jgi:hypothetical protein
VIPGHPVVGHPEPPGDAGQGAAGGGDKGQETSRLKGVNMLIISSLKTFSDKWSQEARLMIIAVLQHIISVSP